MKDNFNFLYFFLAAGLIWLLYKGFIEPAWSDDSVYTENRGSLWYRLKRHCYSMPYRVKEDVMTKNELEFYIELSQYVGTSALIFPKMGLKEIFEVDDGVGREWGLYFSKISQKHVDFTLIDPKTMKLVCAIELDDSSHNRPKARKNDDFKNDIFEATGIPLIRFTTWELISDEKFNDTIGQYIGRFPDAKDAPYCNECGNRMMLTQATSGDEKGNYYWACNNYPNCKNIKEIV
ncbi:MAG: DUF2726 domain-containing protein [Clostridia bacterium]|nr:DUF2726 domain-containing protein [Clostridia bacterium]